MNFEFLHGFGLVINTVVGIYFLHFVRMVARKYLISCYIREKSFGMSLLNPGGFQNPRSQHVGAKILKEMIGGFREQQKDILTHAKRHGAILFQKEMILSQGMGDIELYQAMCDLRIKFLATYGSSVSPKNPKLKNFLTFRIRPVHDNTREINFENASMDANAMLNFAEQHGFVTEASKYGVRLTIVMSIATPYASWRYNYREHLARG